MDIKRKAELVFCQEINEWLADNGESDTFTVLPNNADAIVDGPYAVFKVRKAVETVPGANVYRCEAVVGAISNLDDGRTGQADTQSDFLRKIKDALDALRSQLQALAGGRKVYNAQEFVLYGFTGMQPADNEDEPQSRSDLIGLVIGCAG